MIGLACQVSRSGALSQGESGVTRHKGPAPLGGRWSREEMLEASTIFSGLVIADVSLLLFS